MGPLAYGRALVTKILRTDMTLSFVFYIRSTILPDEWGNTKRCFL